MDPGSFDPSNSGTLSIHHPSVIAGAKALNYTLTGGESQETLMGIVANAPGNALTKFSDAAGLFLGKAALVGATGGLGAPIVAGIDRMTTGSVFGTAKDLGSKALEAAEYVLGNINQTTSAQPTVPTAPPPATGIVAAAQSAAAPAGAAQSIAGVNQSLGAPAASAAYEAPAPVGTTYTGGGFGATVTPSPYATIATQFGPSRAEVETGMTVARAQAQGKLAAEQGRLANQNARGLLAMEDAQAQAAYEATVPTVAQAGTGLFGVAYGMGGEISPSFAIGGKGSFTSFAHYSAGISQADEINISRAGMAEGGAYTSYADAKASIDGMVSGGHSEATISAAATTGTTTQDIEGLAAATGAGDPGVGDPGKVICQELYDQGLLEHSIYSLDEQFGEQLRKHDTDLLEGYHTWAYDVVDAMRKSKTITHIVRIVSRPVVKHIAYKMGYPSKTILGAAMFNVGAFVCRRLAKKETVYA